MGSEEGEVEGCVIFEMYPGAKEKEEPLIRQKAVRYMV